jgi:hypothetical protein
MTTSPWPGAPAPTTPPFVGARPMGPPRPLLGEVDLRTRTRADGRVLAAAGVGAIAFDAALRAGVDTVAAALAFGATAVVLVASRRLAGIQAVALVVAAPVLATFLVVRSSPWLIGPDLLAVVGLLGLAATISAGGSLGDLSIPRLVGRAFVTGLHVLLAPGYAAGAFAERRLPKAWGPIVRGVGIAAPLLVVLAALLASADAVFASFLQLPDVGSVPSHLLLLAMGAWLVVGLVRAADATQAEPFPARPTRLGVVEAAIVLGGVAAVLAAFAVSQVVATTSFGDRVLREAGLTYADHARRGFFQLLAVAALTLVVLLAVRAGTGHDVRLAALGVGVVALTLVVVWVSVSRLGAYEDAYGLTLLRLASTWFAWWIAAVFVALAVRLAGVARDRHWFVGAAGALALVWLVVWNLASPDALVARHDLHRTDADLTYLAGLSSDAVPVIVQALPTVDPAVRQQLVERLCALELVDDGPLAWNASRSNARDALADLCP